MKRTDNRIELIRALSILALVLAVQTTALPAEAHAAGVVLSGFGTATIDGAMSPGEWDHAGSMDIAVNVPEGGTTPGTLFVMNDMSSLYLAIRFVRAAADPGNTAAFGFDNDHSGDERVAGDDVLLINPSFGFFDEVLATEPPCGREASCGFFDTEEGGTDDGTGAFSNKGTFTLYEFSHPLDSADDDHDFSLGPGDTVGFGLMIRIQTRSRLADTYFPTPCLACPSLFGDIVIASDLTDIKPSSFPNSVRPDSEDVLPVALLTTDTLDAATVDPTTVFLGPTGTEAPPVHPTLKDVDGDGDMDMLLHFNTQDTGIQCGDIYVFLTGETRDGQAIERSYSINTVGCE